MYKISLYYRDDNYWITPHHWYHRVINQYGHHTDALRDAIHPYSGLLHGGDLDVPVDEWYVEFFTECDMTEFLLTWC